MSFAMVRPRSGAASRFSRRAGVVLFLLVGVLCATSSAAQVPSTSATPSPHRAWLRAGWDHAWYVEGGLSRSFIMTPDTLALTIDASAGVPPLLALPLTGWRSQAGATVHARGPWQLGLDGSAHTGISVSNDVTSSRVNVNGAFALRPGWYAPGFSVGLEGVARVAALSHVAHSDVVRALFDDRYPAGTPVGTTVGPTDGWVVLPASSFQVGAFAGVTLFEHTALFLQGGLEVAPQLQGAIFVPMLGTLGFYSLMGVAVSW